MPEYQVQVSLKTTSALPEDYAMNNWSIRADDLAALAVATATIMDFYDAIRTYYPALIVQNGHLFKSYDRSDPVPRAPVLEETFNFTSAPTGNALPEEVACCLSFQGDVSSGIPQARNRGRVFIGPLNVSVSDTSARPSSAFRTALAGAADDLLTASDAAAAWTWVVWSTVLNSSGSITNGWVDNSFDTQRRRGRKPSTRTVFP